MLTASLLEKLNNFTQMYNLRHAFEEIEVLLLIFRVLLVVQPRQLLLFFLITDNCALHALCVSESTC